MYVFNVVDANDPETVVAGPFDDGADAGARASELNEQYRDEGSEKRVRVLKAEREPENTIPALWNRHGGRRSAAGPTPETSDQLDLADFRDDPDYDVYTVPENGETWRRELLDTYRHKAAPWTGETWYRESEYATIHYPVSDPDKPEQVRFVPSENAGRNGKYETMTPGRYLQRFFGDSLDDETIQKWALDHATEYKVPDLRVSNDADLIEHVYRNGPRSCMSVDTHAFRSQIHPVRVYAGPDLAVAWIEDRNEKIRARCIVWPENRTYSTIYGDKERMKAALDAAGYRSGSMEEARIQKISDPYAPDAYVMPYIDDCARVREDGEYFVIDAGGAVNATNQTGVTRMHSAQCDLCNERTDERTMAEVGGELWCEHCVDWYTVECDECYSLVHEMDSRETPEFERVTYSGRVVTETLILCTDCYDERVALCDRCHGETWREDLQEAPDDAVIPGDTSLCPGCHETELGRFQAEAERTGLPLRNVIPDTPALADQMHLPIQEADLLHAC